LHISFDAVEACEVVAVVEKASFERAKVVLFSGDFLCRDSVCLLWRMYMARRKRRLFLAFFQWLAPETPEIIMQRFLAEVAIGLVCFAVTVGVAAIVWLLTYICPGSPEVIMLRIVGALLTASAIVMLLYFVFRSTVSFIRCARKYYNDLDNESSTGDSNSNTGGSR
jgi:hypothetical protein